MKMLKLVGFLVVVASVSGTSQSLKDAETEYLKRSIIKRVKEKFEHRVAGASKDVENNDIINGNAATEINIKDDTSSLLDCTMTVGFAAPTPYVEGRFIDNSMMPRNDCIKKCLEEKKSIPSISAVVTKNPESYRWSTGGSGLCYCVKGPNVKIDTFTTKYQSCIFKPMSGDAAAEINIKDVATPLSGTSQSLKDAETEYLKRSIIRHVKEKFEHRVAGASKDVENNDIINGNAAAEINIKDDTSSLLDCTMTAGFAAPTPMEGNMMKQSFMPRDDCIKKCLEEKKSIPSISAVVTRNPESYSWSTGGSGHCYCVKGSNVEIGTTTMYQSCIFKHMSGDAAAEINIKDVAIPLLDVGFEPPMPMEGKMMKQGFMPRSDFDVGFEPPMPLEGNMMKQGFMPRSGDAAAEINIKDVEIPRDPEAVSCCPILDCTMGVGLAFSTPFAAGNMIEMKGVPKNGCISKCLEKKHSIPSISAIVTTIQTDQCFCVKGSNVKMLPDAKTYQSCILKTMSVDSWRKSQEDINQN